MNVDRGPGVEGPLTAEEAEQLDRICDRFEAAWRSGEPLRHEDHLGGSTGPFRDALRAELMAIELEWRRRPVDRPPPVVLRLAETLAGPPDGRWTLAFSPRGGVPGREETRDYSPGPAVEPRARSTVASPIAGYEVLEEIGRGGMGVVYKARQASLNRIVALKVILGEHRAGSKELIRFLAEAEAVASIKDPHVVQVHAYGEAEGRPFLAMEYLPGGSLVDRLDRGPRPGPRAAAELVRTLAGAVRAAHDQGIVHRDLKPANVLFDAEGAPKITDFGLAKRSSGSDITRTHAVMGTPAYMAPEQARGDTKFVGPQADVYSLGVILYECLAGVRPLDSADTLDLLRKVGEQDPDPPSKHVPGLPRDLELIALKCLAKGPNERYPEAGALADDLGRFLAGEPVSVRAAGPIERALKWARRKPTLAASYALAAVVVALLGFGTSLAVSWREADRERRRAILATRAAEDARDGERTARETLARVEYGRTIQLAHQQWRENDVAAAVGLLEGTRPDLRGWEWRYLDRLCHPELVALRADAEAVLSASFDRDGSRVVTSGVDKAARIWDARTGALELVLEGHSKTIPSAAFGPDGSRVVTAGRDGTARVWDARTGAPILVLKGGEKDLEFAEFSPDGSRVIAAGDDRTARIWDARTGRELVRLRGHEGSLISARFSPDGSRVVTASRDETARVWDAASGREIVAFRGHGDGVNWASFSPDGSRVVTAGDDGTARVWDPATGVEILALRGHSGIVYSSAFSADGSRIVTAGADRTARVWDSATGSEVLRLTGHTDLISTASFRRDGRRIVTASSDGTARVWDATRGVEPLVLRGHSEWVESAEFGPDGSRVVTASDDDTARVWDASTGLEILEFGGLEDGANSAAFAPDGARIVTTDGDKTARVWDASTGDELFRLAGHEDYLTSAAFGPDGSRVVTASNDRTARIWDARSGGELRALRGHSETVWTAAFDRRGTRVVTASSDRTARVWDAASGAEVLRLVGHADWARSAAFGPDGSRVVTASDDQTAKVWDAASGALLLTLRGHTGRVTSAAFGPDGSRVVTASEDRSARVWDAASGAELLALKGHVEGLSWASFSPDGSRIVTASEDKTARIWDVRPIDRR